MVFEIFILLSFAISVIMFIVSVKRSKKLKTEKQIYPKETNDKH